MHPKFRVVVNHGYAPCLWCRKQMSLNKPWQKWCSRECKKAWYSERYVKPEVQTHWPKRYESKCKWCGKQFKHAKKVCLYCTDLCGTRAWKANDKKERWKAKFEPSLIAETEAPAAPPGTPVRRRRPARP